MRSELEECAVIEEELRDGLKDNPDYEVIREFDGCDILIRKQKKSFAIVEVKVFDYMHMREAAYSTLLMFSGKYNARYVILAIGKDEYYIQDMVYGKRQDFDSPHSLVEIIQILTTSAALVFDAAAHIEPIRKILKKYNICIGIRKGSLVYDSERNTVSFTPTIERNFFEKIVRTVSAKDSLTYFSSLESLFATLKYNSFRMIALEGMNDKEDGDFLWKYLYGDAKIEEYKKQDETAYIMSCSAADETDLNMWRLYANDTTGVCMKMVVDIDALKDSGFILAHVVYSDDKEMQCLQELIKYFQDLSIMPTFILQQWNVWRPFFKNKDYKVEKEVRLLYLKSKDKYKDSVSVGWLLTNDCKVFSQYVDFVDDRAKKFPLKIRTIFLGPNSPEKETNKRQISQMLENKNTLLDGIYHEGCVTISNINSYRTGRK